MSNIIRQERIMRILSSGTNVSVATLANSLGVTMMTIRRDLDLLLEKGLITKSHGYARIVKNTQILQQSFQERVTENREIKKAIAKKAAEFIKRNDVVCFDAGTTVLEMTGYLPEEINFTAVTTGMIMATRLCSYRNVEVINAGGYIHKSSYSVVNYIAIDNLKQFNYDTAFISSRGFSFPEGTYEAFLSLVEVKRAVVSAAKKVILLADHTKFESNSLSLAVNLNDIDVIITDNLTSPDLIKKIRKKNIDVIVV